MKTKRILSCSLAYRSYFVPSSTFEFLDQGIFASLPRQLLGGVVYDLIDQLEYCCELAFGGVLNLSVSEGAMNVYFAFYFYHAVDAQVDYDGVLHVVPSHDSGIVDAAATHFNLLINLLVSLTTGD